ncbi:MAG TPA: fatty acid desaturase [Vicinamibacterales bacterium]|nr:fatty acid desaturase [Vicinamibacterales bacterium]
MLRYRADIRTLAYLAAMCVVFATLWTFGYDAAAGRFNWSATAPLLPALLLLSVADAVIAHNHNHVSIFTNRWANLGVGYVISFFYGFPAFGWIPTHNMNHHHYNNRPGDYSITTRPLRKVSIFAEALYPSVVSTTQTRLMWPFVRRSWTTNRFLFWRAISESVFFYGAVIGLFVLAWPHWEKWVVFVILPQQSSLFFIQSFNYMQHFETNAESRWDHSRNFTGGLLNAFLFNNGFHTVHHEKPGVHWSLNRSEHEKIAPLMEPRLNQPNAFTFWFGRFVRDPLTGVRSPYRTIPADTTFETVHATLPANAIHDE